MIIGVPRETKPFEFRVAITPPGVTFLVQKGHSLLVEKGAGIGSGFSDHEYHASGAKLVGDRRVLFKKSELVLKVKEPNLQEIKLLREDQILFTFLHLASNLQVMSELRKRRVTSIAYETVETEDGRLPILAPMSEIAGKVAALLGANYLRKDLGGKGLVLAGVGGKRRGHALVLGLGNVGRHAAESLYGLGAFVTLYDRNVDRSESARTSLGNRCQVVSGSLGEVVPKSDLIIGGVLVPGQRAPRLVTREMIKKMEPGSVIVDVAIDQGGCVEGMRPTTLRDPVYTRYGVIHCGVTNLPSLGARSSTLALCEESLPYVEKIASVGLEKALATDSSLARGLNLREGKVIHPALIEFCRGRFAS